MAGKSMQLLKNLHCKEAKESEGSSRGCYHTNAYLYLRIFNCFVLARLQLEQMVKCCISDAERKSLYTLFLESVQSRLCSQEESLTDTVTELQATKRSLIKMQSIMAQHLEMGDVHDPLLAINFARYAAASFLISQHLNII